MRSLSKSIFQAEIHIFVGLCAPLSRSNLTVSVFPHMAASWSGEPLSHWGREEGRGGRGGKGGREGGRENREGGRERREGEEGGREGRREGGIKPMKRSILY